MPRSGYKRRHIHRVQPTRRKYIPGTCQPVLRRTSGHNGYRRPIGRPGQECRIPGIQEAERPFHPVCNRRRDYKKVTGRRPPGHRIVHIFLPFKNSYQRFMGGRIYPAVPRPVLSGYATVTCRGKPGGDSGRESHQSFTAYARFRFFFLDTAVLMPGGKVKISDSLTQ